MSQIPMSQIPNVANPQRRNPHRFSDLSSCPSEQVTEQHWWVTGNLVGGRLLSSPCQTLPTNSQGGPLLNPPASHFFVSLPDLSPFASSYQSCSEKEIQFLRTSGFYSSIVYAPTVLVFLPMFVTSPTPDDWLLCSHGKWKWCLAITVVVAMTAFSLPSL